RRFQLLTRCCQPSSPSMPSRRPNSLSPPAASMSNELSVGVIATPIVNAVFMPCQTLRLPALAVRSLPSTPMDEERSRVARILSERMKALNMDWGALADAIDILVPGRFDSTRQMVENWKRRGVPSSQYALVARAVGYTV